MAIVPISSLTEVESAGENDLLLLSTSTGAKSIKASNVGGSSDFIIEFTMTGESSVTTETTFSDAYSAYQSGKGIKGVMAIPGMGDIILYLTSASEESVVLLSFFNEVFLTITGTSSGWTLNIMQ